MFAKAVWILKRHAGVAAIEEMAQILAGQPDVMAITFGIQEVQDVLQGNVWDVWESIEGHFARGQLFLLRRQSGRRGFVESLLR